MEPQLKLPVNLDEAYDPEVDEIVKLEAQMKPLNLQSMTQTDKDENFGKPGVSCINSSVLPSIVAEHLMHFFF